MILILSFISFVYSGKVPFNNSIRPCSSFTKIILDLIDCTIKELKKNPLSMDINYKNIVYPKPIHEESISVGLFLNSLGTSFHSEVINSNDNTSTPKLHHSMRFKCLEYNISKEYIYKSIAAKLYKIKKEIGYEDKKKLYSNLSTLWIELVNLEYSLHETYMGNLRLHITNYVHKHPNIYLSTKFRNFLITLCYKWEFPEEELEDFYVLEKNRFENEIKKIEFKRCRVQEMITYLSELK